MRLVAALLFLIAPAVGANELCGEVSGAKVIAQNDENTYLGEVASAYDSDSIFNEYGSYGSEYSGDSIWNEYSEWGSEYSSVSPFNKYSSTPPMLIKDGDVIGYLSANKSIEAAVSPAMLKALCEDELQ